jgi:hypothetical protein
MRRRPAKPKACDMGDGGFSAQGLYEEITRKPARVVSVKPHCPHCPRRCRKVHQVVCVVCQHISYLGGG